MTTNPTPVANNLRIAEQVFSPYAVIGSERILFRIYVSNHSAVEIFPGEFLDINEIQLLFCRAKIDKNSPQSFVDEGFVSRHFARLNLSPNDSSQGQPEHYSLPSVSLSDVQDLTTFAQSSKFLSVNLIPKDLQNALNTPPFDFTVILGKDFFDQVSIISENGSGIEIKWSNLRR